MSTTTTRPSTTDRVLPWLLVAGMVLSVAALPVLGSDGPSWSVWAAGAAAVAFPVLAAALLVRSARRDDAALAALATERDELADHLTRTAAALEQHVVELQQEKQARAEAVTAVETAVVALSRKVQASAHRIQEEATRMAQRHGADADVLQSSMRIDHAAAQHARQAQSLVALCGRRPGQTWEDSLPLPDVARAAAGRITAFQRVDVSGDPGLAVVGRAVEPLVHVVAELLANATQSSPPGTQVLVVLRQVQRGAVIEIDDCGVGLDPLELARVRRIVSGEQRVGIADLGEVPQTGLAVVGTYARMLDLRVDLTESVYGGLRAVVLVPAELTEAAAAAPALLVPSAESAWIDPVPSGTVPIVQQDTTPAAGPAADASASELDRPAAAPSLPQRRSRRAELDRPVARPRPAGPSSAGTTPEQTAEEAGAWIGAFFAAANHHETDPEHDPADATTEDR